jgi:hypothetical protein
MSFTTSREQNWREFVATAVFAQGDRRVEVDAFWDGGREWKVRFAPPSIGVWSWTLRSEDSALKNQSGVLRVSAAMPEQVATNANLRGQVRAAGHYFAYADGTPVLLLGDCLLLDGLSIENGDFLKLLDHRRTAGFNALNVRLCKEGAENEGGIVYENDQIDRLNPRHFQFIDRRMQAAWERGFVTFFMPDFLGTRGYSQQDVRDLWRYLLARYGAFNVCAIVTGEYDNRRRLDEYWKNLAHWDEVGDFLRDLNQRGPRVPIGTHPLNSSSGAAFHQKAWLDYNQIQSKIWREFDTVPMSVLEDFARTPPKPTFYAEGTYEYQPWAGITGSPLHIRHQTWVALLCGAAAVDYGEHRLKGGNLDDKPLATYLNMPGARQAALASNYVRSLEWWKMTPLREAVLVGGAVPALDERKANTPLPYCLAQPQQCYIVYLMAGLETQQLTLSGLGQHDYTATWLDPRTGDESAVDGWIAKPDADGQWAIPARPQPSNEDWVIVLRRVSLTSSAHGEGSD